jgi:hypothetical protein
MEFVVEIAAALKRYGEGVVFLVLLIGLWRQYVTEIREWRKQYVQLILQYEKLLVKVSDVFSALNTRLEDRLKE